MPIQFKLEPRLLAAVAPMMGKEETRYHLMGVHVKRADGKTTYEATNGHILGRVVSEIDHDGEEDNFDIIIPSVLVKHLSSKSFLKGYDSEKLEYIWTTIEAQTISVETEKGLIQHKLVDGTYPDTDRVIPKNPTCKGFKNDHIGFNAKYMAAIEKSGKAFAGHSSFSVKFGEDNSSPCTFNLTHHDNGQELLAVLMPLRTAA